MKIKGYEAAALPKSRSRKRHSSLSTSRSTVGEREKKNQHRAWKSKKERNYKEEGNIYNEEDEMVEKSRGREKKIGREGGSRRKESRKGRNGGGGLNPRYLGHDRRASGLYCVVAA